MSDVNEFAPIFSSVIPFSVDENSVAGFVVGKVVATDADRTSSVRYSLVSAEFSINAMSGDISVKSGAVLDF